MNKKSCWRELKILATVLDTTMDALMRRGVDLVRAEHKGKLTKRPDRARSVRTLGNLRRCGGHLCHDFGRFFFCGDRLAAREIDPRIAVEAGVSRRWPNAGDLTHKHIDGFAREVM
jgi:hypothetical protein